MLLSKIVTLKTQIEYGKKWPVGFFVGNTPNYHVVKAVLSRAWKTHQEFNFNSIDDNFYLFKFGSAEGNQKVLEGGPWYVRGQPPVNKRWKEELDLQTVEFSFVLVWIKVSGLRMTCRNADALLRITGCIGHPICMDKQSANGKNFGFHPCVGGNKPRCKATIANHRRLQRIFIRLEGGVPVEAKGLQPLSEL